MTTARSPEASARLFQVFLRWYSNLLLLTGLSALGSYGFVCASTHLYQVYQNERFNQMKETTFALGPFQQRRASFKGTYSANTPQTLIGQLKIPCIGLSAIVLEGDDSLRCDWCCGRILFCICT